MMTFGVITVARSMSPGVIGYARGMVRWEPDARGRLMEAAFALYHERGYDATTVAEIAERAGLTKRSYFRYYGPQPGRG